MSFGLITIIALNFFSCNTSDNPNKYEVCNCSGSKITEITNERGVVVNTSKGFMIITENNGYVKPCDEIPSEFKSGNFPLVTISGKFIPSCEEVLLTTSIIDNGESIPQNNRNDDVRVNTAELQTINPIETIDKIGNVTVKVFYSTNSGGFTGWGYELEKNGFKLYQDEIPAMDGREQFSTKEEAMAFAILVAYKLNIFNDFPSVTIGDLCLFKKYECAQE